MFRMNQYKCTTEHYISGESHAQTISRGQNALQRPNIHTAGWLLHHHRVLFHFPQSRPHPAPPLTPAELYNLFVHQNHTRSTIVNFYTNLSYYYNTYSNTITHIALPESSPPDLHSSVHETETKTKTHTCTQNQHLDKFRIQIQVQTSRVKEIKREWSPHSNTSQYLHTKGLIHCEGLCKRKWRCILLIWLYRV